MNKIFLLMFSLNEISLFNFITKTLFNLIKIIHHNIIVLFSLTNFVNL